MAAVTETAPLNATQVSVSQLTYDDVIVFVGLELLGFTGFLGNILLIFVIFKFGHIKKPSFVLIVNLALADICHALTTTGYFYPPIVLKQNHVQGVLQKLFVFLDWTAWGITITHMSAVCIDRLIAITTLSRYSSIVTTARARAFSLSCWLFFVVLNLTFWLSGACCNVAPQAESDFYSFDYEKPTRPADGAVDAGSLANFNVYPFTYVPLEVTTMCVLLTCTPVTLSQLWRRHRRRMAMRQASRLLLRMTVNVSKLGTSRDKDEPMSPADQAASTAVDQFSQSQRNARVQQARIFIQIIAVTVVFFLYMFVYYLFFYVAPAQSKWLEVFNSVFYSLTSMTNAAVFFACNEDIRRQVLRGVPCLKWCVKQVDKSAAAVKRRQSSKPGLTVAGGNTGLLANSTGAGTHDTRTGCTDEPPLHRRSIDDERSSVYCPPISPLDSGARRRPSAVGADCDWREAMSELSGPYKDSDYGSPRDATAVILGVTFDNDEVLL